MSSLNPFVLDLWKYMSSFEQQVFIKCTSSNSHAGECGVSRTEPNNTSAGTEKAFEVIGHSFFCEPEYHDRQHGRLTNNWNMLLQLINHGQSTLATKLLIHMTSSPASAAAWAKFISGSLDMDVNERQQTGSQRDDCILHAVAREGSCSALVNFLSEKRVGVRNRRGDTPLHLAAEHGRWGDVKILLEHVESLPLNDDGWTPLHAAAASTRPDATVARLLVERMKLTDPMLLNARSAQFHNTALHLAARNIAASSGFIECLVDLDPTLRNSRHMTPLQLAASRRDNSTAVGKLLELFLPLMLASDSHFCGGCSVVDVDEVAPRRQSPEVLSSSNTCIVDIGGFECDRDDPMRRKSNPFDCCGYRKEDTPNVVQSGRLFVGKACAQLEEGAADGSKSPHLQSVLRQCALNGNVESVVRLIRSGVDVGDMLHDVVEESVRRHGKVRELVSVYKVIVENAVVGEDFQRRRCESQDADGRERRAAVLRLIGATRYGKNVLERAIEIGAEDLLLAIVETPGVLRFGEVGELKKDFWTVKCEIYSYDVTNMIRSTMSTGNECCVIDVAARVDQKCRCGESGKSVKIKPDKCYLEMIVEHEDIWRHTDILKRHPFKKLSKSYIGFLRRMYLLVGIIHLAFMVAFSSKYLPTRCSMDQRFRLHLDGCSRDTGSVPARNFVDAAPHWTWLAWPVLLSTYHLYTIGSHLVGTARSLLCLLVAHERFADFRNIGGEAERFGPRIIANVVDKSPFIAFVVAFFFWFAKFDSFRSHVAYLEALSAVFLFGWLLNFMIFNRVTRELYVFSLVLRAVIVEHIIKHFMPIFLFTVIGFSFAFHALGQTRLHRNSSTGGDDDDDEGVNVGTSSIGLVVYETLVCVFGSGYLYDATVGSGFDDDDVITLGGHPGYPKAVFAVYVVFTSLILLNYLIALLNGRYERERARAENAWRFDSLADFVRFERDWSTSWTFGWIHAFDYWFVCLVWPRRQIIKKSSSVDDVCDCVHVVQVQKYRPWPDEDDDG